MSLRIIQITLPAERNKTIYQIADNYSVIDIWSEPKNEEGKRTISILVDREKQQDVLDSIQLHLQDEDNWRAVLIPVEGSIPKIEKDNQAPTKKRFKWQKSLSREELYQAVQNGAEGDLLFYTMVFLSTIVAAIGLIQDNVAIVIAAMVIAPLLGPNLALAFGTALGDRGLIFKSLKTTMGGVIASILPCIVIGYFLPVDMTSEELLSRTDIGYAAIVLALASGGAAVLSMTTGVSSALVGVMVSVALLPPAAAMGIFIGLHQMHNAIYSGLLLITNMTSVGLAAQIVLIFMGVRPRKFIEKRAANQSIIVQVIICSLLLVTISGIIGFTQK